MMQLPGRWSTAQGLVKHIHALVISLFSVQQVRQTEICRQIVWSTAYNGPQGGLGLFVLVAHPRNNAQLHLRFGIARVLFYSLLVVLLGARQIAGFIRFFTLFICFFGCFRDDVVCLEHHAWLRLPNADLPLSQCEPDKYIADPVPLINILFSRVEALGAGSQMISSLGQ